MQLWNDYEGKTIADVYPLGALLRPEGRSAFFTLRDGVEAPAIIRLTEALNDEGQMLACWRSVAEVKQENLVRIKRFGQTNFEGTPLTYAVMEVTDANLADILKERPLTYPEAMQVATSVVAGLSALHAKGLIHEHVDAANILAAGDTVKLRTDCVRECLIDGERLTEAECRELVQRDVHDLAVLMLQSLTLEKKLSPTTKLPAPFDKIVPNGMNGAWGLAEISQALTPQAAKPLVPEGISGPPKTTSRPQPAAPREESVPIPSQVSGLNEPNLHYGQRRDEDDVAAANPRIGLWAVGAFVVIVVIALFLYLHRSKAPSTSSVAPQTTAPQTIAPQAAATGAAGGQASATDSKVASSEGASTAPSGQLAVAAHMQAGWYVIAYTYDHEDQAWKRAGAIMKRHPSLHAEVIAPSGHTPFLIAIGGAMSREEAESVRNSARHDGLPRDTYIRNYKAN